MKRAIKCRNLKDGVIYFLGEDKLKKEPGEWEILFGDEDKEVDERSEYAELKAKLTEMEVPFKGNASKATLKQLLELEEMRLN